MSTIKRLKKFAVITEKINIYNVFKYIKKNYSCATNEGNYKNNSKKNFYEFFQVPTYFNVIFKEIIFEGS